MRIAILSAAAGTLLLAQPALAQDAPFDGPRVEAVVGYDSIPVDGERLDGLLYGGIIGYDRQLGGVVIGAEAELSGATTKAEATDGVESAELRAGRDIYVGARLGYALSDEAMLYVKAGYTNLRVEAEYDDGEEAFEGSAESDGFRVGFGLEYKVAPRVHLKSEYRYSNYGEISDLEVDLDRHQLMAGVGIRF